MKNLDVIKQERQEISRKMQEAIQKGDSESFSNLFVDLCQKIQESVMEEARQLVSEQDTHILTSRGVRQLTSVEKEYYQKVIQAMKSPSPKQELANLDVVMPETIIDSVFEDLKREHPLLSKINFTSVTGLTRIMMNTNGYQKAAWGKLCAAIIQELTSGFKEVDVTQDKLSAFMPVCKAMLDLGPSWLDSYVRQVLEEALANGLEDGIINGTGKDMPIGMIKQVGDEVTVTGGIYPNKKEIKITKLDNVQLGKITSIITMNDKGQPRVAESLILVVNPSDYFAKILPAIQIMVPTGGYVNALPFAIDVIQSAAVPLGKAIYGMANKYFLGAGMGNNGKLEYSDEYHFLEDERVYLIKMYANGFPKDNNAFLLLDIADVKPAYYRVETITETTHIDNANLSDLKIGGNALLPEFDAATTSYTASTTDASNTITAMPEDASAIIEIKIGDKVIANGSRQTWETGENVIKVTVSDGQENKSYSVTVTKKE